MTKRLCLRLARVASASGQAPGPWLTGAALAVRVSARLDSAVTATPSREPQNFRHRFILLSYINQFLRRIRRELSRSVTELPMCSVPVDTAPVGRPRMYVTLKG